MIKIVSGHSNAGGSTVVFNTLVNLFNKNNIPACFYGPYKWKGIDCRFQTVSSFQPTKNDIIIYHFLKFKQRVPSKKLILSCHETDLYKVKEVDPKHYDQVVYVSEYQKTWQGVNGIVIPNPIREFKKKSNDGTKSCAAIIGSLDKNKRVHLSIKKALDDGFTDIRLYGNITDFQYFKIYVQPYLSDIVTYRGVSDDISKVYANVSHVYHSPFKETFNLIKHECAAAGVIYVGNEGNDPKPEIWDNDKIVEAWRKILC